MSVGDGFRASCRFCYPCLQLHDFGFPKEQVFNVFLAHLERPKRSSLRLYLGLVADSISSRVPSPGLDVDFLANPSCLS